MVLAKQLRGEYVLDGTVTKAGAGVRLETRLLMSLTQNTLAQPLPPADGKDVGDAAKSVERSISEALKGMPMFRKCIASLRASKPDDAVTSARAAIAAYPGSVLSRICLLNAYSNKKDSPDSIISVANQILTYDPNSTLALRNLVDAYNAKDDRKGAADAMLRLYRADPTNEAIARSVIDITAGANPLQALALVDSMLANSPGDVELTRKKWQLQLAARQFKNAIATGEELVKLDSTAATLDFYQRQIGAAQSDSNAAKVQEIAAKAAQRFPSFALVVAQSYYRSGQLQQALDAARRAAAADPKSLDAWKFIVATLSDMHQPDSVLAAGKQAIAAGVPKDSVGDLLLGRVVGPAIKAAQTSKTRADWEVALKAAQAADAIASTAQSNFYIGVAAFQVASDMVTVIDPLTKSRKKEDHDQACTLAKQAEDYFATTSIAMPRGASVDKDTAGKILGAVGQYGEFVTQVKKAFCK
jgi:tetratricopeptide (TPR) repeat protein